MKNLTLTHGVIARAILFSLTYLTVPVLIVQMGITRYADYLLITGLLSFCYIFEFGNSNNIIEIAYSAENDFNRKKFLKEYLYRAKKLAGFVILGACTFIGLSNVLDFNPRGIQISRSMYYAIFAGVLGVGLTFLANTLTKFGIACGYYKKVMKVTTVSTLISTLLFMFSAYLQNSLWIIISLQFLLQPLLILLTLRKMDLSLKSEINTDIKKRQDFVTPRPHVLFKFYAVFIPIYGNLIFILYASQSDKTVFAAATTVYRVVSIPLVLASFAWVNLLWIEIGKLTSSRLASNIELTIFKKMLTSFIVVAPFFIVFSIFGSEIIAIWTRGNIIISHSTQIQFSLLGLTQFMGIVPGAVTLVCRKTKLILSTHIVFLITLLIIFKLVTLRIDVEDIPALLVFIEIITIFLPNIFWIFKYLPKELKSLNEKNLS